jgi:hypothetical protein
VIRLSIFRFLCEAQKEIQEKELLRIHPPVNLGRMNFLDRHLLRLGQQHNIRVDFKPDRDINAFPSERRVDVHPCTTGWLYCLALHELGHVALFHRPEQNRAWKEVAAWAWAQKHCVKVNRPDVFYKCRAHCLACWNIYIVDLPDIIKHWDKHTYTVNKLQWDFPI